MPDHHHDIDDLNYDHTDDVGKYDRDIDDLTLMMLANMIMILIILIMITLIMLLNIIMILMILSMITLMMLVNMLMMSSSLVDCSFIIANFMKTPLLLLVTLKSKQSAEGLQFS